MAEASVQVLTGNDGGAAQSRASSKSGWASARRAVFASSALRSSFKLKEPGIDVRRRDYKSEFGHLNEPVEVFCVDYCASKVQESRVPADGLAAFVARARAPWSKARWLVVTGMNWGVVETLAQRYRLHPLAVEALVRLAHGTKVRPVAGRGCMGGTQRPAPDGRIGRLGAVSRHPGLRKQLFI